MKYSANSVWENKDQYDVAVIGVGHAGCEAALACARLGFSYNCIYCQRRQYCTYAVQSEYWRKF